MFIPLILGVFIGLVIIPLMIVVFLAFAAALALKLLAAVAGYVVVVGMALWVVRRAIQRKAPQFGPVDQEKGSSIPVIRRME